MPDVTSATKVLTEARGICQQGKVHLHKIFSSEKKESNTRQGVLSNVASVFDPLGLILLVI